MPRYICISRHNIWQSLNMILQWTSRRNPICENPREWKTETSEIIVRVDCSSWRFQTYRTVTVQYVGAHPTSWNLFGGFKSRLVDCLRRGLRWRMYFHLWERSWNSIRAFMHKDNVSRRYHASPSVSFLFQTTRLMFNKSFVTNSIRIVLIRYIIIFAWRSTAHL
jgi:hypothetical protein